MISIHALLKRATLLNAVNFYFRSYFNSRSPEESDLQGILNWTK